MFIMSPHARGEQTFAAHGHGHGRLALQVTPHGAGSCPRHHTEAEQQSGAEGGYKIGPSGATWSPRGVKQLAPRIDMKRFSESLLTPRQADTAADAPWIRVETPEHERVPKTRQQAHRWTRALDVRREQGVLAGLKKEHAETWPCDRCPQDGDAEMMMGSLKVLEAKQQCVAVRRIVQAEQREVVQARARAAAKGTQEVTDTVESLLQLGMTDFEASMEQFQRADNSLSRLRLNTNARPPPLDYDPASTELEFGRMRERYYRNRGTEMSHLLKQIGVDRSGASFADGGPVLNRVKKDPNEGLDLELDVVGLPGSPMGFSVLRYPREQDENSEGQGISVFEGSERKDKVPREKQPYQHVVGGVGGGEIRAARDSRLVELANLGRDDKTLEYMVHMAKGEDYEFEAGNTLSNRERFRMNPLWIDVDAGPSSRLNTGYTQVLPRHAHETNVIRKPQRQRHERSPGRKRYDGGPERGDFIASSPVNDRDESSKIKRNAARQQVEREGNFMRASCRYAKGESLKHPSARHKGITVKPMAYLNNTV